MVTSKARTFVAVETFLRIGKPIADMPSPPLSDPRDQILNRHVQAS